LIPFGLGDTLQVPNKQLAYAYFPTSGICSVIAENLGGVEAETGIIGREGFVGISIAMFAETAPARVIVQAPGRALKISRAKLLTAIGASHSLHVTLLRFAHVFTVQISQTAVANGHYTINQRLARWLLMCQDREESPELPMTHKFLSVMLTVRRAGITEALNFLEGASCVQALRNRIVITDRKCLEKIAGPAYGIPEREYRRLIA